MHEGSQPTKRYPLKVHKIRHSEIQPPRAMARRFGEFLGGMNNLELELGGGGGLQI